MKLRRPCDNCPWRVDAPREHWDPQHFADIWRNCQDDGPAVMLCHKANALPEEDRSSLVCQGWARVMGTDAIGVRIALFRGDLSPEEVADVAGPTLFDSFRAMLVANRIPVPRRNAAVQLECAELSRDVGGDDSDRAAPRDRSARQARKDPDRPGVSSPTTVERRRRRVRTRG